MNSMKRNRESAKRHEPILRKKSLWKNEKFTFHTVEITGILSHWENSVKLTVLLKSY